MPAVLDKAFRFSSSTSSSRKSLLRNLSGHKTHSPHQYSKIWTGSRVFQSRWFKLLRDQETDMPGEWRQKSRYNQEEDKLKPEEAKGQQTTLTGQKDTTAGSKTAESGAEGRANSTHCQESKSEAPVPSSVSDLQGPQPRESPDQDDRVKQLQSDAVKFSTIYLDRHLKGELQQRRDQLVDQFMALALECMERHLEPFEEPCDGVGCASHTQTSQQSSRGFKTSTASLQSKSQSIGEKRQLQRDDHENSGSDNDDDNNRRRHTKRAKTSKTDQVIPKYACPYYKYNPGRFRNERTCCGPGWEDIHRVKEHLKRCHALPSFHCERCLDLFKSRTELSKHQRAKRGCALREPLTNPRDLSDGYDNDQEVLITRRNRKPGHEKWVDLYCILFNVEPGSDSIPSPWHGVADTSDWRTGHTDRGRYEEYVNHIRQELPVFLRGNFEKLADKHLQGVERSVRTNLLGDINNIDFINFLQSIPPPLGDDEDKTAAPEIPVALQPQQLAGSLSEALQSDIAWLEQDVTSLSNFPLLDTEAYNDPGLDFDWGAFSVLPPLAYPLDSSCYISDSSQLATSTAATSSVGQRSDKSESHTEPHKVGAVSDGNVAVLVPYDCYASY